MQILCFVSEAVQETLQSIMQSATPPGSTMVVAQTWEKAAEVIETGFIPDVVIIEKEQEGVSCFLAWLWKQHISCAKVIIGAALEPKRFIPLGFLSVIQKPLDIDKLKNSLMAAIQISCNRKQLSPDHQVWHSVIPDCLTYGFC